MGISEKKMQIVINNYFKQECDVNTSIREAFEKGFRIGIKKASSAQPEPPADVAPVVFCKYCRKRRKDGYCTKFIQNISGIASVWYMPQDDDFCSCGERREE